jgi:hypothetical protein
LEIAGYTAVDEISRYLPPLRPDYPLHLVFAQVMLVFSFSGISHFVMNVVGWGELRKRLAALQYPRYSTARGTVHARDEERRLGL